MKRTNSNVPFLLAGALLATTGLVAGACSDDDNGGSPSQTSSSGPSSSSSGPGGAGGSGNEGGAGGAGAAGGGGPAASVDCSPPGGAEGALKLTQIARDIEHPLLVKGAPGDLERIFILSQPGVIYVTRAGASKPTVFLDIQSLIAYAGGNDERGLLGFAFHPDYQNNGRFFVHYSDRQTSDTRIVEFKRGASADVADPNPVATLLEQEQPQGNHNGGSIEFSPRDGFLYIGLGDGGNRDDEGPGHSDIGNGQDLSTLLGKMLRIDVASNPYAIPQGNMSGNGVRPEIWDYGMRNPYRFSFDACNGDLYIGDVGQEEWEEIDIEPAGEGNKNYGWRLKEGDHCFNPSSNCDPNGTTTPPAFEYNHSGDVFDNCSVTGGYVYRGRNIPWLRGTYFFGDWCSGRVWTLKYEPGATSEPVDRTEDLETLGGSIAGFGQDTAGELYVTDFSGGVFRIDAE